jgi:DNA-binding transcriptional LysR family regulator
MNNRFFEMQLFETLIERSSFTAAAEAMHITPSAASKLIKRLEERLGVRLLNRTTRSISPTEEGLLYYYNVKRILQDINEIENRLASSQCQVSGTLRMSVPSAFSAFHLLKLLAEFQNLYPLVSLDLAFSDRFVDIVEEGFELVIRIGALPTAKVPFTILCENRRYLAASRGYIETHGMPQQTHDLASHRLIDFTSLNNNGAWELLENGQQIVVPIRSACRVNNGLAALFLCEMGVGIAPVADFAAADLLADDRLVQVLPGCVFPSSFIYALSASELYLSSRAKQMIEFLQLNMQPSFSSFTAPF